MGHFISGEEKNVQDIYFDQALSNYAKSTSKNLSKESLEKSKLETALSSQDPIYLAAMHDNPQDKNQTIMDLVSFPIGADEPTCFKVTMDNTTQQVVHSSAVRFDKLSEEAQQQSLHLFDHYEDPENNTPNRPS